MAFSVGGEYTGVLIFPLEHAAPNRRGFLTSLAVSSSGIGGLLAIGTVTILSRKLSPIQMDSWGWRRIPFAPLAGIVSDRWGRKPILVSTVILVGLSSYPLYFIMTLKHYYGIVFSILLFAFYTAAFNAVAVTSIAEHFPTRLRFSGFTIDYNISATLFGGLSPLIATLLIRYTEYTVAPSYLLIGVSLLLFPIVVFCVKETAPTQTRAKV